MFLEMKMHLNANTFSVKKIEKKKKDERDQCFATLSTHFT